MLLYKNRPSGIYFTYLKANSISHRRTPESLSVDITCQAASGLALPQTIRASLVLSALYLSAGLLQPGRQRSIRQPRAFFLRADDAGPRWGGQLSLRGDRCHLPTGGAHLDGGASKAGKLRSVRQNVRVSIEKEASPPDTGVGLDEMRMSIDRLLYLVTHLRWKQEVRFGPGFTRTSIRWSPNWLGRSSVDSNTAG